MDFSNTLKDLRELHDVTQEQLADFLQVSRSTVAGYETKNRQPDFERLEKIAEFFNVTIDYLITGFETEPSSSANENSLDQEVMISYRRLSINSKQDVLKYIRLLELRDKSEN